jgi:ubiquitin-protein ligase
MKPLQFRMAKMELDRHALYQNILAGSQMSAAPDRMRRIAREMSSLSSSLPLNFGSSIFVRVDESRADVLKAVIIGPEDTPYSNGCFCFDIFLPPQYPQVPPKVCLQTTGRGRVRFNPNLYANGKVCLSLLGTWQGPGWDPKHSTVLQVRLSHTLSLYLSLSLS